MSSLKGGKTPPRLLDDLQLYNPAKLPQSGYNILTELAFPFDPDRPQPRTTAKGSCRHRWIPKPSQTSRILSDPSVLRVSHAAAFCADCRCHVKLVLDTTRSQGGGGVCPNGSYPLHHFRHRENDNPGLMRDDQGHPEWKDERTFECSSAACAALLRVTMHSSRLSKTDTALLTDKALIQERAEHVMSADPERFEGHPIPNPLAVLSTFRAYIDNSFKLGPKKIKDNNKKWLLCLGDGCKDLVESVGFTREDENWDPPHPDLNDHEPYFNPTNIMLDDVMCELDALMIEQPADDKRVQKIAQELKSDTQHFLKFFGCEDYRRSLVSRTTAVNPGDEHPWYAGLGAVLDFHDDLIQFGYERQIACDPGNSSYYLESLNGIAEGRKSEDLKTKAAIEASTGKLSSTEIKEAYSAFTLDVYSQTLDDDHIIGVFQSRASDAPMQEAELRRNLTIIGKHRQSRKIEEFAANTVTTYEQALSWLGATADMDDSFVIAMYGVKQNENPAYIELARTCVKMIADHRESTALKGWLSTGQLGDVEMDVAHAYQLLELPDRTIADDSIIPSYLVLVGENPTKKHTYEKALRAIAEDRGSEYLKAYLTDMGADADKRDLTLPVGLGNIGNTCYLNSLLQYFFSVKPIRELVLDFDNQKEDLTDAAWTGKKQAGGRVFSKEEAMKSQEFVVELRQLYRSMINSSNKVVTPKKKLAHLTIFTLEKAASVRVRRESVSLAKKPMSQAEAMAQMADANPVETILETPEINGHEIEHDPDAMEEDKNSDSTLVDKPAELSLDEDLAKQADAFENKENLAPTIEETPRPRSPEKTLQPLAPTSPSRTNEQQSVNSAAMQVDEPYAVASKDVLQPHEAEAPTRLPPPVPPRTNVAKTKDNILEEIEFEASQRDVTEVIDNVLFQLQIAMKPKSVGEEGHSIDTTKQLFYGKIAEHYRGGDLASAEDIFQDIKVQLPDGPRHIYEALDATFDEQNICIKDAIVSKHSTILELPPILQIFVSRGQFDKKTGKASKSMHHLQLDKTIYMDRYLETQDEELLKKRKASWKWKRQLWDLRARRDYLARTDINMTLGDALEFTAAYVRQQADATANGMTEGSEHAELVRKIQESAERTKHEFENLNKRIQCLEEQISTQFDSLTSHAYNLFSVIVHIGSLTSGHYWVLIHDFQKGVWRKYNDGRVTEVDEKEVLTAGNTPNKPNTSTFVVYVKAGMEHELTQTVVEPMQNDWSEAESSDPSNEAQDIEMTD